MKNKNKKGEKMTTQVKSTSEKMKMDNGDYHYFNSKVVLINNVKFPKAFDCYVDVSEKEAIKLAKMEKNEVGEYSTDMDSKSRVKRQYKINKESA